MAKWADYVITRVRYNSAGTHIDQVEVADDGDDAIGPKRNEPRVTVLANLKAKKTYVTAPPSKTDASKITKGASVGTVVVSGTDYLRTKIVRDSARTGTPDPTNVVDQGLCPLPVPNLPWTSFTRRGWRRRSGDRRRSADAKDEVRDDHREG